MPAAIRSAFTASVVFASASVIAVSPLAQTPEVHIPTVQIPGIELAAVPAFGAIPYQILVNLLGDGLAIAPIVIGGIQQCEVCIGPVSPPSPAESPFTGWGALGFGVGLLTSPFAAIGALQAGQSLTQALGVALLAIQIPADNTFALLAAPRESIGGYEFAATRARARQAITDALVGTIGVVEQVLTGARTIVSSGLVGITDFAQTLADTGEIITALQAGLAPVRAATVAALNSTVEAVQVLREAVYDDLTAGPGPAARPIPIVSAAAAASSVTAARVAAKPRAAAVASAVGQSTPAAKVSKSAGAHKTRAAAQTRSVG